LACDGQGIALGPTPLVVATGKGGAGRCSVIPIEGLEQALTLAYGAQSPATVKRCHAGLRRIAARLEEGDVASAGVEAVFLRFDPISRGGMAKLRNADDLLKDGTAWQDQPRVPAGETGGGQWTSEGGTAGGPNPSQAPAADTDHAPVKELQPVDVDAATSMRLPIATITTRWWRR
jgi:hypothetical protein